MISAKEYIKGRDQDYPLTMQMYENMVALLSKVNVIRELWGQPMIVTSGYRPAGYNLAAGGAPKSHHMTCLAIDIADPNGKLKAWIMDQTGLLERLGLYMEDPADTISWCHLQIPPPTSGRRVFRSGVPKKLLV